MLWWERLLEITTGVLAVAIPTTYGVFHRLKAPVFGPNPSSMVIGSIVYMKDSKGKWWGMQPAGVKGVDQLV